MAQKASNNDSSIRGVVTNTKGRPIAGAEVKCNGEETGTLFDGTFNIENLVPSTYVVTVTQKGFQNQKKEIKLGKHQNADLDFRLIIKEGGGKIYGYVLDSKTSKPIGSGGTMIMILPSNNKQIPIRQKDGYFEFSKLPADTHQIWTSILEYDDEFKEIQLEENEKKRVDFLIRKNEAVEPPWG